MHQKSRHLYDDESDEDRYSPRGSDDSEDDDTGLRDEPDGGLEASQLEEGIFVVM
jgi:hypothetical protein